MECYTLFHSLTQIIVTSPPSPTALSPHHTALSATATHFRQTLKGLAEQYAFLYNFHQPAIMVFQFFTIIAYTCLGEEDLQHNLSTRQLFTTCFNAINDTVETVFLANTVLPPLEAAARKQIGAMWSPSQNRDSSVARRETQLSDIIERTYSAYPSDMSNPDFDAARADFVLRSMANLSLDKVSPLTGQPQS